MTDFIDEDLSRDRTARTPREPSGNEVSNFNLTRMAKHRVQVEDQVASAMKELEQLRQRQEDLETQKKNLEDLRTRQSDYERGRREMIDCLSQSLIKLEKEQIRAEQMVDLLTRTRKEFKVRLKDIEDLNEEQWTEEVLRDELAKALTTIDEARVEYQRALAAIDSAKAENRRSSTPLASSPGEDQGLVPLKSRSFGEHFLTGFALSLPLIITLILISVLLYFKMTGVL